MPYLMGLLSFMLLFVLGVGAAFMVTGCERIAPARLCLDKDYERGK